jgi:hypothetical protein
MGIAHFTIIKYFVMHDIQAHTSLVMYSVQHIDPKQVLVCGKNEVLRRDPKDL